MTDGRFIELLRSLSPGQAMWLPAQGNSLWPLVRSGDVLQVRRDAEAALAPGDIALLEYPGALVAHLVVRVKPLTTASSVGVVDPPALGVLGRVVALRRHGVRVGIPGWTRPALALVPALAGWARRVPGAQRLVRWLRDGPPRR
jgi:mycothiol synthase